MARTRTTKRLAKRIELHYFQQPHPFRRLVRWLTIAALAVSAGWIGLSAASKDNSPYSRGPLSTPHAMFSKNCVLCHGGVRAAGPEANSRSASLATGFFRRPVSDPACLQCHAGPAHHERQVLDRGMRTDCAGCHVEHKGFADIRLFSDRSCTQCHADLRVREGTTSFVKNISSFSPTGHPEFAVLRLKSRDTAQLKLNHQAHLKQGLRLQDGTVVQMNCSDCHRPANYSRSWPYGQVPPERPGKSPGGSAGPPSSDARHMAPVDYARQCSGCHDRDLEFDKSGLFPGIHAPHDRPEIVHAFLLEQYRQALARNPRLKMESPQALVRYPGRRSPPLTPRTNDAWVAERVREAETLLFMKGCKVCHAIEYAAEALPVIVPTAVPARWFSHAFFDHHAHRALTCVACHDRAPDSTRTADVLLPGIKACLECHSGAKNEGTFSTGNTRARSGCAECHVYHDQTGPGKLWEGAREIRELTKVIR
ncbi:MAG: hypothetical protein HY650_15510 [Acidobacteria bacterium]|nr:hypothetical protein [Acidobacteriota bacterium]